MSVKGLDSACCRVVWRVRPYNGKACGLNPGLWLSALPDILLQELPQDIINMVTKFCAGY
ncbi:hypothetical protein [Sporomusa sp. KB1]|uniref:hypothetical protein n=1 Tax=Sporomusa sp. KB1 TaxID=943346 RepID=UPI001C971C28|nr:hypothetical protein [Sporomusa sp. KB1]